MTGTVGLQSTIDALIDDLVAATGRSRALCEAAHSYKGSWRDNPTIAKWTVGAQGQGRTGPAVGLAGCRRSVPHLQRLLSHLETSLKDLERAVGA